MNICGNFAETGECGTCENYILCEVCSGVCSINFEEVMSNDKCINNKYKTITI